MRRHHSHELLEHNIKLFQHPEHTQSKVKWICITLQTIFTHLIQDHEAGEISQIYYCNSIERLKDCLVIQGLMESPYIDFMAILKAYNQLPVIHIAD